MPQRPQLVTFDFYTALVDCHATIVPALRRTLSEAVDAADLGREWRTKQLEWTQLSNSLGRDRIPFRECTQLALRHVLARHRIRAGESDIGILVAAWDCLSPWPEAVATLRTLKARGYSIAILSNGDEAMLRSGAAAFDVAFDHVFASDQAGHYKPHPSMYALPTTRAGIATRDVLHVAGSGNDVLGAKLAGLRCAWSNRPGEPPADARGLADHEVRDLSGLLAIL
jgi:2-haloacid dehalogenase